MALAFHENEKWSLRTELDLIYFCPNRNIINSTCFSNGFSSFFHCSWKALVFRSTRFKFLSIMWNPISITCLGKTCTKSGLGSALIFSRFSIGRPLSPLKTFTYLFKTCPRRNNTQQTLLTFKKLCHFKSVRY